MKPLISLTLHPEDRRTQITHAQTEFMNALNCSSALGDLQTNQVQAILPISPLPFPIDERQSMLLDSL
jgi:hypothetical protein